MTSSPLISCLSSSSRRTLLTCLRRDVAEVGGQAVVVVLGPDVERVVVAPGALEPDAEEDLADRLGGGLRVAVGPVEARRRVLPGRAAGGDDAGGRTRRAATSRGDLVAEPALEDPDALRRPSSSPRCGAGRPTSGPRSRRTRAASSRRSTSFARFSGSRSARKARASSGVGSTPMASR